MRLSVRAGRGARISGGPLFWLLVGPLVLMGYLLAGAFMLAMMLLSVPVAMMRHSAAKRRARERAARRSAVKPSVVKASARPVSPARPAARRPSVQRPQTDSTRAPLAKAAGQERHRQVAGLAAWAAAALADPDVVILDTETTGLNTTARIVEIAVVTAAGVTLLDTLVNPGRPIPERVTGYHGIRNDMVADAPSFAALLPRLGEVLRGRRVLIYNLSYDLGRLRHELKRAGVDAAGWLAAARWEDAMIPYSDWVGDWSEHHGNYAWQPLDGGHRALGDCLAVVKCLREMAATSAAWPQDR